MNWANLLVIETKDLIDTGLLLLKKYIFSKKHMENNIHLYDSISQYLSSTYMATH